MTSAEGARIGREWHPDLFLCHHPRNHKRTAHPPSGQATGTLGTVRRISFSRRKKICDSTHIATIRGWGTPSNRISALDADEKTTFPIKSPRSLLPQYGQSTSGNAEQLTER